MDNITIFACGGAGTNITKQIANFDLNRYYIDTSKSNIKDISMDNVFLLEDIDGAGKNRSKTYEHFKDIASDVLIRFKPSKSLNIVISSLSGGSGSIIAPFICKELIQKNYNTIVIGINSKGSLKEMDNTVKTLKTYKSISNSVNKSVALYYIENESRSECDRKVIGLVTLLHLVMNKHSTEEFDTTDMTNFINFNNVTENDVNVGIIEINDNKTIIPEKNTSIVSTILVTKNRETNISTTIPEYLATCIVTDSSYNNEDIRIDNILGKLSLIISDLEKDINNFTDNKKINKISNISVEGNEHGIVI